MIVIKNGKEFMENAQAMKYIISNLETLNFLVIMKVLQFLIIKKIIFSSF
jgi:hypothetical protein